MPTPPSGAGNTPFTLYGYNRVTLKRDAHLVARYRDDPMIATCTYGQGRTAIFASDFAPLGGRLSALGWLREVLDTDAALAGKLLTVIASWKLQRNA